MRLCRFGPHGSEKPGLVDGANTLRDLSGHLDDITPQSLSPHILAHLSRIDPSTLERVEDSPRLGVPIDGIGKIIGIGLNYADHASEAGLPLPTEPAMFMKSISSLVAPNDGVVLPRGSTHSDWEVELGVFIGKTCRYVEPADALDHVAGYTVANDISERFDQKQRGTQWSKGKGHDTFCPVGPWLVTPDEVGDVQDLEMFLDVNGARMQAGTTRSMIFPVREIISYVSCYVTLFPGDLLLTGTPAGVGEGKKPTPVYLAPGDLVHLGIAKLGEQCQRVSEWRAVDDERPS